MLPYLSSKHVTVELLDRKATEPTLFVFVPSRSPLAKLLKETVAFLYPRKILAQFENHETVFQKMMNTVILVTRSLLSKSLNDNVACLHGTRHGTYQATAYRHCVTRLLLQLFAKDGGNTECQCRLPVCSYKAMRVSVAAPQAYRAKALLVALCWRLF